jgi:hypothetical protein
MEGIDPADVLEKIIYAWAFWVTTSLLKRGKDCNAAHRKIRKIENGNGHHEETVEKQNGSGSGSHDGPPLDTGGR